MLLCFNCNISVVLLAVSLRIAMDWSAVYDFGIFF